MARITREQVQHVAGLALLDFDDDEIASMTRDLERILDYVAALEQLDTAGIEPTAHAIEVAMPSREDRAEAPIDPELAVANAPESARTAFVVPKVIDAEEGGA